jgi:ATP-dependent DNA ligase
MGEKGIDFEALQLRLHPAESRVRMLAAKTPSAFVAFDMLAEGEEDLRRTPFAERRRRLEAAIGGRSDPLYITPMTHAAETAHDWFDRFEGAGFDGIIAKKADLTYQPGVRAMLKIKHLRTVDAVVGGFRWYKDMEGKAVGSLLLGLYGDDGTFHFVGHTSSFDAKAKQALVARLQPYITDDEGEGFGAGRTPGGPSRWNAGKDVSWIRLRPEVVIEGTFDYLQGERFRHAATFKRWRTDKPPEACTFDQLEATVPYELAQVFVEK